MKIDILKFHENFMKISMKFQNIMKLKDTYSLEGKLWPT